MSAHKANPIQYSSQEIDNESFNDTYKIREVALYLYQASTDTFVPAKADSSGSIITSGTSGGGTAAASYTVQHYSDTSYDYYCKATPGTSLASSLWQITRLDANTNVQFAGGSAGFTNAATDLATVQAYSYS